jgi:ubiquinone biosynthesis protein
VAKHGLAQYLSRGEGDAAAVPGDSGDAGNAAKRFRAILEELGPTFVKFGQILSTRADLLPAGFAEALVDLQDHVAPMAFDTVQVAVKEALGAPIDELFSEFDRQPIASASIAQVHRAVTQSGEVVAVKVQRPGIQNKILSDLDLLALLAQLAEALIAESGLVTPRAVVDEFESAILAELDFQREAQNMRRFARAAGDSRSYRVPRVYDELSTRRVLTMEFIVGEKVSAITDPERRRRVAENIVKSAFDQVFDDGMFHADPHPGNAYVLEDDRIALLDFGSVGEISYAMRETLVVLVVAVGLRDADSVARLLYRVGIPDGRVSLYELRDACASLFDQYLRDQATIANIEAAELLKDLFELAASYRIRIPSEYALVTRAAITVEGVIRQLDPELEVMHIVRPYVNRLIEEQLAVAQLGDGAMRNLVRARGFLRDLPLTASQILTDLEAGKLTLQVENPRFEQIGRNIDALGITVFMGLIASALVGGALEYMARYDAELWGLPLLPSAAVFLASVLFGGALGRFFLAPHLRKLSITRWLNRRRRF